MVAQGLQGLGMACVGIGAFFFLAGTFGLLRFPDVYSRLHALTKADNLGLGFVVLGLLLQPSSLATRLHILLVWLLALAAAATVCHLLARTSLAEGVAASGSGNLSAGASKGGATEPAPEGTRVERNR